MTFKIMKYELRDIARNKWIVGYALFFAILTEGLFRFGGDSGKTIVSLLNIALLVIPLVSVMFGTMFFYNAREFVELLLSQPIPRKSLFLGMFGGLVLPLIIAFCAGVGIPFLIRSGRSEQEMMSFGLLLIAGIFLTMIFTALAFAVSVRMDDKVRGLATSLLAWLVFGILYDGMVLFAVVNFGDYSLENAMIAMSVANPIDLARILVMLKFDISALMGYTGAVFQKFFGSSFGMGISLVSLLAWTILPLIFGAKSFQKKDF